VVLKDRERKVTSTSGVETERERRHLPVVLRQRERGDIYQWCCETEREVTSTGGVETKREVTSAGGVETERERGDIYRWR